MEPAHSGTPRAATTAVLLTLAAWIATGEPVRAQSDSSLPTLLSRIDRFVRHDVFIEPGAGLRRVRIGQQMTAVVAAWGNPKHISRSGFLGRIRHLHYEYGDGTRIVASGDSRLESLTFRGPVTSVYQTVDGARFGMAPHQVRSIYGPPDAAAAGAGRLDYPALGIGFGFTQGALAEMVVRQAGPQESG